MNLAKKYTHVCSVCPEARVDGLRFVYHDDWRCVGADGYISADIAQSLIENAWTKILLARGYWLTSNQPHPVPQFSFENEHREFEDQEPMFPTILEAAAARLAPEKM